MVQTIRFHETGGPEVLRYEDLPVRAPGPAVGGPQVAQLVAACAPGATVIVHGGLSGQPTPLPGGGYAPVWLRRYRVFEITTDPAALRRAEHFVRSGLATGAFAPVVDRIFDFDDVAAAHRYVDSPERGPGKPVIRLQHPSR